MKRFLELIEWRKCDGAVHIFQTPSLVIVSVFIIGAVVVSGLDRLIT